MAQLGKYTRLLLDSYLVTSDTSDIELRMTRGETETPTHESPTKFLLNEAAAELTINGYISKLPNAFVLEKRLSAIFDDPDGTHYMALIPDYRIGSGWDPAYVGTIQSSKMDIKAVSDSVVTISGTMQIRSVSRPDLGETWDDLRANCIYYTESQAFAEMEAAFGAYKDLGVAPGKSTVTVFTWSRTGSDNTWWNAEKSATGSGSGTAVFQDDNEIGTTAGVSFAVTSDITQRYVRFSFLSETNETCGVAAFLQTTPA